MTGSLWVMVRLRGQEVGGDEVCGGSSVERLGLGKPITASLETRKIEDQCGYRSLCWYLG